MKPSKERSEAEVRDWYAKAKAGTLTPPISPEEAAELLSLLDEIETNFSYPLPAEKIEFEVLPRKEATLTPASNYRIAVHPEKMHKK